MRFIDGLSPLATIAGRPASCRSGNIISHDFLRIRLTALLVGFACLFALMGCAGLIVDYTTPSADLQPPANLPMMIRTLGTDHQFSQVSSIIMANRLRALHAEEPLSILALSGGGNAGAFGAGAVAGLTLSGARPTFAVVTGVSVGALIAPYAFLGPAWDSRLLDAFTSEAEEKLLQPRGLGVIFGSSLYSGAPLKHLVDAYVSDMMIRAIAREADKGRLLLVATTDVATGAPVVWDLGAIAKTAAQPQEHCFATSWWLPPACPGCFPQSSSTSSRTECATMRRTLMETPPCLFSSPQRLCRHLPGAVDDAHRTEVFVIIDGPLGDAARSMRLTARGILTQSIHAGLNHLLRTTLELTAATAQLEGADLQFSAVPAAYPTIDSFDFRAEVRRPLFRYAYDCARAGRLWTAFPRTANDNSTSRTMPPTQTVPCPADAPLIGSRLTFGNELAAPPR